MPTNFSNLFSNLDNSQLVDDFASSSRPTHNGIDIGAQQGIFLNDWVYAPEKLVNVVTGYSASNGNYLIGMSESGTRKYAFLHLSELPPTGDRDAGFVVGKVGNTGQVINGNVHLHLSVLMKKTEYQARELKKSLPGPSADWVYVSFAELAKQAY